MARKFLTSIDLNSNELIKAVVQNATSDPGTGKAGQLYYNTADDVLKVYSGSASAWVSVGSSEFIGDAVADLLDAGDGIYLNYDDENDSLTITNTGVLSVSGTPSEVEVSASAGNVTIGLPSSITVDVTGDLTGNADTATTLETARAISLGGSLSGSASFDGSSDITITTGDLSGNADTATTLETARAIALGGSLSGSASFDGSSDITITTGDLSGNADTATALETARTISLGGSLSGSASFDGTTDITITADIVAESIALGTDTTGDYVAGATAGDGIDISGSGGEGSTLTISNTGVLSVAGTTDEITVSASAGNVTIGLPDDVTIAGDLTVNGDLTVSGSVTYINTETLTIEDNIVLFNSDQTGTPLVDAGIEIERGDLPNSSLYWDESEEEWAVNNGSATYAISLEGHTHSASAITDFNSAVDDEIDSYLQGSDSISISSGVIDTIINGAPSASFLTNVGGLAVDKSALETALVSDSFTRKYSLTIGDNSATSFGVTHNLGSRDVVVNVYDIATYETVEVDVVRTNTNTVTVTFAEAPATNSYRVVVVG